MRFQTFSALAAAVFLLSACASIIEGSTDSVNIHSVTNTPMSCNATNERGTWIGNTPGQVTVKKSRTDLKLACQDPRTGAQASGTLESDVEPWAFGNILFGGLIGIGVDWGTGAAYDYPENVTVTAAAPTAYYAPAAAPAVSYAPAPATAVAPVIAPAPAVTPSTNTIYYYAPATAPVTVEAVPAGNIAPLPFGGPTPPPAY